MSGDRRDLRGLFLIFQICVFLALICVSNFRSWGFSGTRGRLHREGVGRLVRGCREDGIGFPLFSGLSETCGLECYV